MSVNCDEITLGACVESAVGRGVGNELLMGDCWNAVSCEAIVPIRRIFRVNLGTSYTNVILDVL